MARPNILIFMCDQMLADVVRPENRCLMPNAEHLAREGVRFERAFCTAPHCCPSRASFHTGEYPSKHGIWNNVSNRCAINRDLNPGVGTFAEILRASGYDLAFSGKWHISDLRTPEDFGWREFCVTPGKGCWQRSRIEAYDEYARNPCTPPTGPGIIRRPGWRDCVAHQTWPKGTVGCPESVEKGIEAIVSVAERGGPWCVYVGCNEPHDMYRAPEEYVQLYDHVEIPLPESYAGELKDKPRIYERMRRQFWDQLGEDGARETIKHYWARCTWVDAFLGRILDALEQTGQAENTLVLFLSDHGDYAGAHGIWCKGVPAFREAYAIPAIVRWPAGILHPGRTVGELVSIADFMPTFLQIAADRTPQVFGDSLLPFLRDEPPQTWRDALFTQMNGVELYYTQRAVSTKQWKYVYNGFDFDEMYDLRNDPHEMVNLANPDLYDQTHRERDGEHVPWPHMTPELEAVRKDMYTRLWTFARKQEDHFIYTPYITTGQAAYGPLFGIDPAG